MGKRLFVIVLLSTIGIFITIFLKNQNSGNWKQATSQNFGFAISYPPTWRETEDQNLFSLVDNKSPAKQFKTYIRITNKSPFGPNPNPKDTFEKIYNASDSSDISNLFNHDQQIVQRQKKTKNLTVDNQRAVEILEETSMPGPYVTNAVFIEHNSNYYVVRITAESTSALNQESMAFQQIMTTFKFIN